MSQQACMEDRAEQRGLDDELNDKTAQQHVDDQPPLGALAAFVRAVTNARYAAPRLPPWWQVHAVQLEPGGCSYCDAKVGEAPMLDPIIPIVAGGPHSPHAVVLCCKGCKVSRGRKDLLLWKPDALGALRTLRTRMALEAWNHLTRDPAAMKTKTDAETVLTRRWSQPRFYCHAATIEEGGFIGWRDRVQVPSMMSLRLIFEHQAGHLRAPGRQAHQRHGDSAIFWISTRRAALDAIWDVIECNGLVRPVELSTPVAPVDNTADPSHDWNLILPAAADLVRRRWRKQR